MTSTLAMVAATAWDGVIGREGRLPWRCPTDLLRFKTLTLGKPVIMGRKTFAAIGRVLPGRTSIVLSRSAAIPETETLLSAPDLAAAVAHAQARARRDDVDEIMIAGGGQVFAQLFPRVGRLYLTLIDLHVAGDAHFPAYDPADWREIRREAGIRGPDDEAAMTFLDLERRRPVPAL